MTTNSPEAVAWRWRKPVVNDQGETVGVTNWVLSETPEFLPWWTNDTLIRLSDYEALQDDHERLKAECEQLRKDAERYRCIRKGNQWIVAATQAGFHVDGEELDGLIDSQMEE